MPPPPSSWQNAVQTALVPGKAAGVYEEPDHSRGEEWPGKQAQTKQLSLFETTFVDQRHHTTRTPSVAPLRPPPKKQTSMVRFLYATASPESEDDEDERR